MTKTRKHVWKKGFSWLLTVALVLSLLPAMTPKALAGFTNTGTISSGTSAGTTLYSGYIYTVSGSPSITAGSGQNGLNVAGGATVVIYIPAGQTLTVRGGAGSGQTGGGAGIYLPASSTLVVTGGGALRAYGGAAANGGSGASGGDAWGLDNVWHPGYGGAGGDGGGGAGAGIGTGGGSGGSGGSQVNDHSAGGMSQNGWPQTTGGSAGSNGSGSGSMGTLSVLSGSSVSGTGGPGGSGGNGGDGGGTSFWYEGGGWYRYAGAGGGGGGGGGGASGHDIGAGGPGGGGGGAGSTGAVKADQNNPHMLCGTGGNGGGGGGTAGHYGYYNKSGSGYDTAAWLYGTADNGGVVDGGASNSRASFQDTLVTGGYCYAGYPGHGGDRGAYGSDGTNSTLSTHTAVQYTLTLNQQGGGSGSTSVTATYCVSMPAFTAPSKTGYTFTGYYTAASGGVQIYDAARTARTNVSGYTNASGQWIRPGDTTLHAQWTPITYTVHYNPNKPTGTGNTVTGATANSSHTYDQAKNLTANGFSLTGWSFQGWANTSGDNQPIVFANGASVSNLMSIQGSTKELYAVWQANQYTLNFHANGGKGATSTTVTYDSPIQATGVTAPTRTGYVFDGYWTTSTGGTCYFDKDMKVVPQDKKWDIDAHTTLYAHWTPLTYHIDFYSENSYAYEMKDVVYGVLTVPTAEAAGISRENYTFKGWNIYDNQNWAMYTPGTHHVGLVEKQGETVNLYAAWQENEKFTLSYNANGGKGEPGAVDVYIGNDHTLAYENDPTQVNHSFLGWSLDPNATAASFAKGDTIANVRANLTLYAVWKQNPKLSHNANGGVFSAAVADVYPASGVLVSPTTIPVTKAGYTLAGWTADAQGGGPVYGPGTPYTMGTTDVTLYAKWAPTAYTLSLSVTGSCQVTGLADGSTASYGDTVAFTVDETAARVYLNGSALTRGLDGKYTFTVTGNTTVQVVMAAAGQYLVTYNPNGGTGSPVDFSTYAAGENAAVKFSSTPLRSGYAFSGWAESAEAATPVYTPGGTTNLTISGDTCLYAVWTPYQYTVSFHSNGGTGGTMNPQTIQYGTATALTENAFEKTGSQFKGWSLSASDDTITFKDEAPVKNLTETQGGSITLYAVWGSQESTIYFDAQGGSLVGARYIYATYGSALTDNLNPPTRQGYVFGGWYWNTLEVYGPTMAPKIAPWTYNIAEVTLTAKWTPITYAVVLVNGSTELSYPYFSSVSYADTITLPTATSLAAYGLTIPSDQYLAGWTTLPGSSAVYYTDGQEITTGLSGQQGASVFLYAVLKDRASYTLRYDTNGGLGAPLDSNRYYPGATVTVNFATIPTLDGYSFLGWGATPTGTALYTQTGTTSFSMGEEPVTLYAVWQANSYTVQYDNNGGTGTIQAQSLTYGGAGTLSDGMGFSKTGHRFLGWATNAKGAVYYGPGASVWNLTSQPQGVITLYAVWQAIGYQVTFQNGASTFATAQVPYGSPYGPLPQGPLKEGHSFSGWFTAPTGGTQVTAATLYTTVGETTLHAQWEAQRYLVIFDAQGGAVSPASNSFLYGGIYGTLPIPTRAGFTFDGWYTAANGSGTRIQETSTVAITAISTFYAKWAAQSGATVGVTVTGGDNVTVSGLLPSYLPGETVRFSIAPQAGYSTSAMAVAVNGAAITPTNGYYSFIIQEDTTIGITGVAQILFTVSLPAPANASLQHTDPTSGITPGGSFSFTVTVAAGYSGQNMAVKTNGSALTAVSAAGQVYQYTISDIRANQTVTITGISSGGSGDMGGGGGGGVVAPGGQGVIIIVDGVEYPIGALEEAGGTILVEADEAQLAQRVAAAEAGSSVVVIVPGQAPIRSAQLTLEIVAAMAEKEMDLSVRFEGLTVTIPAAVFYQEAIARALNASDYGAVTMNVSVQVPSAAVTEGVAATVEKGGAAVVCPPLELTVTATMGSVTRPVTAFGGFVTRTVEVTREEAAQITTAVVWEGGTLRHVPTRVYEENGRWYADVNSLTNSVYALIHHVLTFPDALGRWYQESVEEMGSRMIINGMEDGSFEGDRGITRAEFAAITIRSLGLPGTAGQVFDDVVPSDWYAGAVHTAQAYGIIQGRDQHSFDPQANITRQEAMTMVWRAAKLAGLPENPGDLVGFADGAQVADWAKESARFNIGAGLIQGSEGRLYPESEITRAESAAVLLRLLQAAQLV